MLLTHLDTAQRLPVHQRKKEQKIVTMQTNRNTHAHGPHGSERTKDTQKQELPNRSPELAVTKTQLSLGRKKNRVFTVMSAYDVTLVGLELGRVNYQHIFSTSPLIKTSGTLYPS